MAKTTLFNSTPFKPTHTQLKYTERLDMADYIIPQSIHSDLVSAAYVHRGYSKEEGLAAARFCELAAHHGIKTHNAIKAIHLDELFGSAVGGCVPGAEIEVCETRFKSCERWNANKKLGQAVAFAAIDRCIELADEFGVGSVMIDNAFHYLWGGGYVIDAAKKGYIAYTNCTSALAEVVPFGGKFPTLGTNPHSWAFPTQDAIGYPICIDWATSTVAMGRVQQFAREGKQLPPASAVDADGNETTDPKKVAALLPFGNHKGYGLSLIDEIYAAYGGGSLPTLRGRPDANKAGEKFSTCFFFQVTHPDAFKSDHYACGRDQASNVKAVLDDILGHGNEHCLLPGQIEARAAAATEKAGGLIFTEAEVAAFSEIASDCNFAVDCSSFAEHSA